MIGTVNRIFGLARLEEIDSNNFSSIDMHRVAAEILIHLEALIIHLEALIQVRNCNTALKMEGAAEFEGDIDSIRETVLNLIENAVKHSPSGARIHITCGPGGHISVEDNGPGFPEDVCESLLQSSSKESSKTAGLGLGLTIAQRTAELHGGVIELG